MLTSLGLPANAMREDINGEGPPASPASRRLLVLISEADEDDSQLPGRIQQLAAQRGCPVALLAMYGGEESHARVRRQLISLAATIRGPNTPVEILTRPGHDWIRQIESLSRPGDLVVCSLGATAGKGSSPASAIMNSELAVPVHVLTRMADTPPDRRSLGQTALIWAANLGLLAGFLWLQARIDQIDAPTIRTVLFGLSIGLEVGLLWVWNTFAG